MSNAKTMLGSLLVVSTLGVLSAKLVSCGKSSSSGKAPTSTSNSVPGNLNIKVQSKAATALTAGSEGCDCSTPGTSMGGPTCGSRPDGKCYTPTAIRGHFNRLSVSGSRLLGGGNKYQGLEDVLRTAYFDLDAPVFLDGDDNLQDAAPSSFAIVDLSVQSIEYQFLGAGKYFNVRIPMVTVPIANDPIISACVSNGGLGDAAKYTKLYADGISVTAGDILVCIKDAKTDVCKDADYQWVDATGTLASTRPSSPLKLSGAYAFQSPTCKAGQAYPDLSWGAMNINASLAQALGVTAKIDQGKKTYTYNGTTGNTLDVVISFDMSQQLFVPNVAAAAFASTDYAADGATLRRNLDKITLRQIFQHNTSTQAKHTIDSDNMGSASISVSVSTKDETADGDVEDLSKTLKPNEGG